MCENPNSMKKKTNEKQHQRMKEKKKHKIDDVQDQHNSGAMANFSHFDQDKL